MSLLLPRPAAMEETDHPRLGPPLVLGLATAVGFFGLFGLWSALAPLDSAVVAPGEVIVESRRKVVQHLEGGIVEEVLVAEGEHVAAGQPLLRLSDVASRAEYARLAGEVEALRAQEARLGAERDGLDAIPFPPELTGHRDDDGAIRQILLGQQAIFAARRAALLGQTDILTRKVHQLERQIEGLRAQEAASKRQLVLFEAELVDANHLLAHGLTTRPRILALERQAAQMRGAAGDNAALIAKAEEEIGETRLRMLDLANQRADQVAGELRDVQTKLADAVERKAAALDVQRRRVVPAPVAGVVVGLKVFTQGGIIQPGAPAMEIVPEDDRLVVRARIRPLDADKVHAGLPAHLRLLPYKRRTTPVVEGQVTQVSADRLTDDKSGESYYDARIEVDRAQLAHLPGVKLLPGMPVDTLVTTGQRTLLDYLVGPIGESMSKAFREQ
jgi:HlyD family secretion protein